MLRVASSQLSALLLLLLAVATASARPRRETGPFDVINALDSTLTAGEDNGQNLCLACTVAIHVIAGYADYHKEPIEQVMDKVCSFFPDVIQVPCHAFLATWGDIIIHMLVNAATPDQVCQKITLCQDPKCHLFPQSGAEYQRQHLSQPLFSTGEVNMFSRNPKFQEQTQQLDKSPWEWLLEQLAKVTKSHLPIEDADGDRHSIVAQLRGSNWRGKDCNDLSNKIYPGSGEDLDADIDHNCNGIKGKDASGTPYEQLLCDGTDPLGLIVIGDSASAHFRIPQTYIDPKLVNMKTYAHALELLADELDFPMISWITGFADGHVDSPGPAGSIYKMMRERNRCIHRDFQNIGVNGARTLSQVDISKSLHRHPTDRPVLLVYSLLGNDVCSPHSGLDHMTKVEDMRKAVTETFARFDTQLPPGSHMVILGVIDGRVIWDAQAEHVHPLGVKTRDLFAFERCVGQCPCWIWMHEDQAIRDAGSARAAELDAVYTEIVKSQNYKNFDITYIGDPIALLKEEWIKTGKPLWGLFEPFDAFHPNQEGNDLLAKVVWKKIEEVAPHVLPKENPHNAEIEKLFGDQGGY